MNTDGPEAAQPPKEDPAGKEAPTDVRAGGAVPGLSPDDLITLNEEIAGMARAGLPLDQGLAALAREMGRGRLQRVTAELAADLKAGHTLPEALARQGNRVPPFYAGLVAAGIRTGRITQVLATLTVYARSLADLRSIVVGALIYPAIVLAFALLLFGLTCTYVIPQYVEIYRDFKLKLPFVSEMVIAFGSHPVTFVFLPLGVLTAGWVGLYLALRASPGGHRLWARFVYAIPIVGTMIRSARMAAFADLLGILVDHGVPLPEAFRVAGAAASDPLTAHAAQQIEDDLTHGHTLGDVLRRRAVVPELIAWMAGLGEQRGTLGGTLHQVATMYRRQVEMRAVLLRGVLPSLLIIFTAAIVLALFAFGILLPLFGLLEGLSGAKG